MQRIWDRDSPRQDVIFVYGKLDMWSSSPVVHGYQPMEGPVGQEEEEEEEYQGRGEEKQPQQQPL